MLGFDGSFVKPLKEFGILPVMGQEYSKGHHVCGLFLDHKSETRDNGPLIEEFALRKNP